MFLLRRGRQLLQASHQALLARGMASPSRSGSAKRKQSEGAAGQPAKRRLPPIKYPGPGSTDLGDGAFVDFTPQLYAPEKAAALFQELRDSIT